MGADIVGVGGEERAVEEELRAGGYVVFVVEELVAVGRDELQPGAQGLVDGVVGGAGARQDLLEFWW